jgi:hypothetical protein
VNLSFFIRKFLNLIKISAKKRTRKALPEDVSNTQEETITPPVLEEEAAIPQTDLKKCK